MEKMKCELCSGVARIYCESDEASLCFSCDGKVHGANFLVAKHTRCLLCLECQTPTPWKASGLRLGRTLSICESCPARKKNNSCRNEGQEIIDCGRDELKTSGEKEEEEGENQVVPWDVTAAEQQPPVASSSSSVSINRDLVAKRTRRDFDLNCSLHEEIDDSNDSRPSKRLSAIKASLRLRGRMAVDSLIANKSRDFTR